MYLCIYQSIYVIVHLSYQPKASRELWLLSAHVAGIAGCGWGNDMVPIVVVAVVVVVVTVAVVIVDVVVVVVIVVVDNVG